MPAVYQPRSLVSLSRKRVKFEILKVITMLADLPGQGLDMTRDELVSLCREICQPLWGGGALPGTLRSQLLLECIEELNGLTPMSFAVCMAQNDRLALLLAAMMDQDIAEVRVRLCCFGRCVHKDLVMEVLGHGIGAGLVTLELARPSLSCLNKRLFQSILLSANNLTKLVLRNIACDRILKVVGKSCFKLNILDISQTNKVTDKGIINLFHTPIEVFYDSERPLHNPRRLLVNEYLNHSNEPALIKAIQEVDWPTVAVDRGRPRPYTAAWLCGSLHMLDVSDTGVTRIGVLTALLSADGLRSLGSRCHSGRALELLSRCAVLRPDGDGLQLTEVCTCHATAAKLRAIGAMCPRLCALTVTGPVLDPAELDAAMPGALVRLNVKQMPVERAWVDGLRAYLHGPRSRSLRQLSLMFRPAGSLYGMPGFHWGGHRDNDGDGDRNGDGDGERDGDGDGDAEDNDSDQDNQDGQDDQDDYDNDEGEDEDPVTFDLGAFLFEMPELETLVLDGIEVTFATPPLPARVLDRLRCVNFGVTECPDTLTRLMRCAPGLEVVHTYTCPGMDHATVLEVFSGAARLRCMYVDFVADVGEDTVELLAVNCPAISHIGNVYNWGLNNGSIINLVQWLVENNFDVQLHGSAHWFSCNCFP